LKYNQPFDQPLNPNAAFVDGNPSSGTQGSIPPAASIEYPQREIVGVVAGSGFTPTNADLAQLAKAIRSQALNYLADSGAANALVVTPALTLDAYTAGLTLRIAVAHPNSGATTVNAGPGVVSLTYPDGSALVNNELFTGRLIEAKYDGAKFILEGRRDSAGSKISLVNGLIAAPATTFNVGSSTSATVVSSFGAVTSNLASTFAAGVLTIAAGEDGWYLVGAWLGTNLQIGSLGGTNAAYGWTQAVNVNRGSGYSSVAGFTGYTASACTNGPFSGAAVMVHLNVGDLLESTISQNGGITQNAPCGLGVIFLGK
jgi:hypothetical protein